MPLQLADLHAMRVRHVLQNGAITYQSKRQHKPHGSSTSTPLELDAANATSSTVFDIERRKTAAALDEHTRMRFSDQTPTLARAASNAPGTASS